jgi:hypothetical protein
MNAPTASETSAFDPYCVRRMQPSDASGVVACLRSIYGSTYVHPELYDPAEIVRLNESLQLVSVVTIDASEQVVGHYALERPQLSQIAEAGVAIVLPEHRHHQLMERMRVVLEQEATRLQLVGLFGHAVTNHTFSQQVDERFQEEPCALSLGWSPRTFHNLAEPLPQRMSELLYFKYLKRPTEATVFLPEHHADWCMRIYEELGLTVINEPGELPQGSGQLTVTSRRDLGRAVVQVKQLGENSIETIESLVDDLSHQGAEAIFLELPLAQAGTPVACLAAESRGFFFSGIGPSFAEDGDALRLQKLRAPLDPNLILVESAHARDLLGYVVAERARIAGLI